MIHGFITAQILADHHLPHQARQFCSYHPPSRANRLFAAALVHTLPLPQPGVIIKNPASLHERTFSSIQAFRIFRSANCGKVLNHAVFLRSRSFFIKSNMPKATIKIEINCDVDRAPTEPRIRSPLKNSIIKRPTP